MGNGLSPRVRRHHPGVGGTPVTVHTRPGDEPYQKDEGEVNWGNLGKKLWVESRVKETLEE